MTASAKGVLAVAQPVIQVSALLGELLLQLDRPSHQHLHITVAHDLATHWHTIWQQDAQRTIAGAGVENKLEWLGLPKW